MGPKQFCMLDERLSMLSSNMVFSTRKFMFRLRDRMQKNPRFPSLSPLFPPHILAQRLSAALVSACVRLEGGYHHVYMQLLWEETKEPTWDDTAYVEELGLPGSKPSQIKSQPRSCANGV